MSHYNVWGCWKGSLTADEQHHYEHKNWLRWFMLIIILAYSKCLLENRFVPTAKILSWIWNSIEISLGLEMWYIDKRMSIRSSDNDSNGFWQPGSLHTLAADGHI